MQKYTKEESQKRSRELVRKYCCNCCNYDQENETIPELAKKMIICAAVSLAKITENSDFNLSYPYNIADVIEKDLNEKRYDKVLNELEEKYFYKKGDIPADVKIAALLIFGAFAFHNQTPKCSFTKCDQRISKKCQESEKCDKCQGCKVDLKYCENHTKICKKCFAKYHWNCNYVCECGQDLTTELPVV